jgi:hypothetical protein
MRTVRKSVLTASMTRVCSAVASGLIEELFKLSELGLTCLLDQGLSTTGLAFGARLRK